MSASVAQDAASRTPRTVPDVPVEGGTGRAVVSPAVSTLRDEMAVLGQILLAIRADSRLTRARTQFLLGEYELSAFAAMREVEIRVRELAGAEDSLIGVKLMRQSFKPDGGPLADAGLDAGEQVGMMELFAGAIGTFKNPPSHRQINYDDPTEASEVVLLADLLMRILDRLWAGLSS